MLDLTEIPVAPAARKTYLSVLANLDKWLKGREITDETLSEYLSYLFDKGKSPVLGNTVLAATRWRAECEDKPDPRGKLCRRAIASFRRKGADRERGQVAGLTYEDVDKLIDLAANTLRIPRSKQINSPKAKTNT